MKYALLAAAVFAVAISTPTSEAQAARRQVITRQQSGGGFFAQLMEMERRKNERLRQMFTGR